MAEEQPTPEVHEPQAKPGRWVNSSRAKRARRIAAGLCLTCGKVKEGGMATCAACRLRMRERQKLYTERRREERAKLPPKPTPVSADMPAYKRQWRAARKRSGVCTSCGGPRDTRNRVRCTACRQADKEAYALKDAALKRKQIEAIRLNRSLWVAEGRCTWCGGLRDRDGRKRCSACTNRSTADNHRRRSILALCEGSFTAAEWQAVKAGQDYTCLRCGRREPEIMLTVDHIKPVSKFGPNDISNIQALCLPCNVRKHAKKEDYRGLKDS